MGDPVGTAAEPGEQAAGAASGRVRAHGRRLAVGAAAVWRQFARERGPLAAGVVRSERNL